MAIVLDDITQVDLEGEGSFDVLMRTLRLHIAEAVTDNEITQAEAGAIYTGVIPSIVQQAVEFELRKDLVAQQILTEQEHTREAYVTRIIKDKEASKLGLDTVLKDVNITPETVYTPKYIDTNAGAI